MVAIFYFWRVFEHVSFDFVFVEETRLVVSHISSLIHCILSIYLKYTTHKTHVIKVSYVCNFFYQIFQLSVLMQHLYNYHHTWRIYLQIILHCQTFLAVFSWSSSFMDGSVRPSVCPSVTPFSLCSHHLIVMKFSGVITINRSDVHTKGQG